MIGTSSDVRNEFPETYVEGFHDEEAVRKMEYQNFGNTGMRISAISFGCGGISPGLYEEPDDQEALLTVQTAVKKGINYIDIAPWYGFGTAEPTLGRALVNIPRKAYYIATKVGRYLPEYDKRFDFSAEKTFKSVNQSLKHLGVEYIDVIQVHDIEFAASFDILLNETLPTLLKLKEANKVRFIGITGCPPEKLYELYKRSPIRIDSVLSHSNCCIFNTYFNEFVDDYRKDGVATINAAILGLGLLTEREPMDWHPAAPELIDACKKAAVYCKERGVNISKICVNFALKTFKGTTNIIGVATRELLDKNLEVYYNKLSDNESRVCEEVYEKFFRNVKETSWADREVEHFWKNYRIAIEDRKKNK